ncbi:MAG: Dabb family protein [Rhodothermales bacterium]
MKLIAAFLLVLTATVLTTAMLPTQKGPVRHVVIFKYKAGATDAQIAEITNAFRALKDKIPGITQFEHGINNSPEGLNQGFTHVYQLTFKDTAARDAYLPHPDHAAFGKLLGASGIFEGAFVVDYEVTE